MRALRIAAAVALSACSGFAAASLPLEVAQPLATARIPLTAVAAVVQELDSERYLLRVNGAASMNPASVMKLVTTYAALELLGPSYAWRTEVFLGGPLREGVLEGPLLLRGGGDPKLDLESFWRLLRTLRGKGLREIRGDVVLDRSRFERVRARAGDFDGEIFRPYNVLPDALLLNFRSLRFLFVPSPETGTVRISVEPRPPSLELVNVLKLVEGGCPEGSAFRDLLKPTFEPERPRAIFSGRYPQKCGDKELYVSMLAPNDQVAGVIRQLWAEIGGTWSGAVLEGEVPRGTPAFYVHESPPLSELVRDVNKRSNNVMARQIFLSLGAEAPGAPATHGAAAAAVRAWLARRGIAAPEFVIENGNGLSRNERLSADSAAALLRSAWRSPLMPEFMASLPITAIDGTMRRRLKSDPVAGRAHIKTGLLSDVRALAGYVMGQSGKRLAVVMIVNHANAHQAQEAMDALLRWAYAQG